MTNEKLSKIYYDPEHLWTGRKAINLLRKESGLPPKVVKEWLAKQAIWQIHLPKPKKIDYAHFYVTKPHKLHQADLLFLPHDKVYQNTYKYTLNVIDIASGYKASRPLRTKKAKEVAEAFKDIYKKGPLRYPDELHVDSGTEFKGEVLKLMKEHDVPVKSVVTKYHHSFTAFVENFNKMLAERLFKAQDAQELRNGEDSKIWVKYLQKQVTRLNNSKLERTGTTPAKAVKLDEVTLKIKPYEKEEIAPTDGLYRYLLEPGEENADQRRRATDSIWSRKTYRLDRIVEDPGQRVLYYLTDGPTRAFVREELMLIPEDTEVPPESVEKW
jgi:transposase InsO family protein